MSGRDAPTRETDRLSPSAMLLLAASLSAVLVVPGLPYLQLHDPGHWGLLAFLAVAALFLRKRHASWSPRSMNRFNARCVLAGMPVIYVAYAFLEGGSGHSLLWESSGLAFWVVLAIMAGRRLELIWIGVLLHAIWDAAHFGRTDYVPDWYSAACLAADIGLAGFIRMSLLETRSDGGLGTTPTTTPKAGKSP